MALPGFVATDFSRERLNEALTNCFRDAADSADDKKIGRIFNHLAELKAVSIIKEEQYIDGSFLEDYAEFYARCASNYARKCGRVHFFSKPGHSPEIHIDGVLESLILGGTEDDLEPYREAYLGFIVVRPLPEAILGRTLLKIYPPEQDERFVDERDRRWFPATSMHRAHLCGISFDVQSLPFMEQDGATATCATIALWTCLQQCTKIFDIAPLRPAQVTRLANTASHEGRSLPTTGLTIRQVCHVIKQCGLEAEVFRIAGENGEPAIPWVSLVTSYLRAGIPVIMSVMSGNEREDHAIAISGFGFRKEPKRVSEWKHEGVEGGMCGQWVGEFYAHDDQRIPFCHFYISTDSDPNKRGRPLLLEWIDGSMATNTKQNAVTPVSIVVPVHNKIRITFTDVRKVLSCVTATIAIALGNEEAKKLEWDLWLTTVNSMKAAMRKSPDAKRIYKGLLTAQLPRFIWRATLEFDSGVVLELFFDATNTKKSVFLFEALVRSENFCEALLRKRQEDEANANVKKPLKENLGRAWDVEFYRLIREGVEHPENSGEEESVD